MKIIEIKKRVEDMTERDLFVGLFYGLLTKNDYFKPILDYLERKNKLLENFVYDIYYEYEKYDYVCPYKFLDNITNYIKEYPNNNLELSEILDCIPEYNWD